MMDKYGMHTVDFKHLAYLDETFVFAKDVDFNLISMMEPKWTPLGFCRRH
jgi:hypothetical protein